MTPRVLLKYNAEGKEMVKSNAVTIRISDTEKAAIKVRARNAGMSLSKYMIYSSLCQAEKAQRRSPHINAKGT